MMKKKGEQRDDSSMDWEHRASDSGRTDDMRQANENIRKAQGEDSADGKSFERKPAIDRDR